MEINQRSYVKAYLYLLNIPKNISLLGRNALDSPVLDLHCVKHLISCLRQHCQDETLKKGIFIN